MKSLTTSIPVLWFLSQIIQSHGEGYPVVETPLGAVEGRWKASFDGRKYAAFEGIPYAKPPIGDKRFQEPEPIEPWSGTWPATKLYECPQYHMGSHGSVSGQEDCLYINVFVPDKEHVQNLDVLLYIHGGGFISGSGSEYVDPKYLMDRDWIFVSFNYRLGALGFLSTEDEVVPGNNGMKDQVLAMKWVQQNIKHFGGSPDSVTIAGFSAGAAAAHFHYFSPMSKGLFKRGMSVSGTAIDAWAMTENPAQKAKKLAEETGCNSSNSKDIVNCLKARPADLLVAKSFESLHSLFPPAPFCPFTPVVESKSVNSFLPEHPYKVLTQGGVLDVPWITSVTSDEGLMFGLMLASSLDKMDSRWTEVAEAVLSYEGTLPPSGKSEIADKIRKFYFGNGSINKQNWDKIVKMFTDRYMSVDADLAAQLQAKTTKAPVYFYRFEYEGENSFMDIFTNENIPGTSHGDDMIYFFGGLITKPLSERDIKLKNICMDILYSYVTTGVPVVGSDRWTPVKEKLNYLNITGPEIIKMEVKTDFTINKFWADLGLQENANLFPSKDEL